jgi:hypothetical protein
MKISCMQYLLPVDTRIFQSYCLTFECSGRSTGRVTPDHLDDIGDYRYRGKLKHGPYRKRDPLLKDAVIHIEKEFSQFCARGQWGRS